MFFFDRISLKCWQCRQLATLSSAICLCDHSLTFRKRSGELFYIAPIILFHIFVAFPFTRFHLEIRVSRFILWRVTVTQKIALSSRLQPPNTYFTPIDFGQPRNKKSKQKKTKHNNKKINDFSAFLPAAVNEIWSISFNCVDGFDFKLRTFRYAKYSSYLINLSGAFFIILLKIGEHFFLW